MVWTAFSNGQLEAAAADTGELAPGLQERLFSQRLSKAGSLEGPLQGVLLSAMSAGKAWDSRVPGASECARLRMPLTRTFLRPAVVVEAGAEEGGAVRALSAAAPAGPLPQLSGSSPGNGWPMPEHGSAALATAATSAPSPLAPTPSLIAAVQLQSQPTMLEQIAEVAPSEEADEGGLAGLAARPSGLPPPPSHLKLSARLGHHGPLPVAAMASGNILAPPHGALGRVSGRQLGSGYVEERRGAASNIGRISLPQHMLSSLVSSVLAGGRAVAGLCGVKLHQPAWAWSWLHAPLTQWCLGEQLYAGPWANGQTDRC